MAQRRHVLVPIDGSPQAEAALEFALEEIDDATFTALTVLDPAEAGAGTEVGMAAHGDEWMAAAEDRAEERLQRAEERAEEFGRDLRTATAVGRPSRSIVEYAEDEDVDQIVMGSHGREGISRVLLGSVAENVVRRSPVPVTVVR